MYEEIDAIEKNDTWELMTLQSNKKPIGVKWVYKVKKNFKSEVERYKARFIVKGYKIRAGIDYDEVFTPVTRLEMIRLLISLATLNKWKIHHMDVKLPFLNGFLDEEVYIEQLEGYMFDDFKKKMAKEFEMTNIGLMPYYLGIELSLDDFHKIVSQCKMKQPSEDVETDYLGLGYKIKDNLSLSPTSILDMANLINAKSNKETAASLCVHSICSNMFSSRDMIIGVGYSASQLQK
ncbi:hypothetical protein RJ639_036838 [Escallonia herrerae]|uniref:Reverse transcriptase Ty1/copia-type domain-containing protein n=1 Tax=Escallonia herrerae TaxID=1293975 RepID=A0AA88WP75_9ASTE|nr:hypothetical protein RJ639_036838 [Escallonia herrerae]